jgi:predicted nucleotidyltransferase
MNAIDGELQQKISNWASTVDFRVRIYFYGSRLKGKSTIESDLDLALEFLEGWVNRTLTWMDFHDQWESELSKRTNLKVHLELHDAENFHVRSYVREKSMIIFESPERTDTDDDEEFERELAQILKEE